MFDGLLKSKFYSKCKSDIKLTRTRIEMIRKKRNAMQKYLRNDVADLLKNGLDIDAYGRAEGLLVELNRSNCYEFIEQYCEHILKHLSAMNKQRECPEECREAASSLMFAAARFADLPELRELRTLFSDRYGSSLDCYVNKQFAEKLKSGLPSKDMKLQLLQDIAAESSLEWNSKALENKLFNESAYNKNFAKETDDSEYSLHNDMDGFVQKKDRRGTAHELQYAREFDPERKKDLSYYEQKEATRNEDRLPKKKESAEPPRDGIGPPLPKRHEVPPVKDIQVDTIGRTEKPNEPASVSIVPKEENEDKPLKYRSIPPPYTKSEVNKPKSSLRDRGSDSCKDKLEPTEPADAEENHDQDDSVPKAKPMSKSVRTRNLKPPPGAEIGGGSEGDEKEKLKQTNKEKAALGQRILKFFDDGGCDQRDDEEKMMDKLLQRYSRKKGSRGKAKSESVLNPPPPQHASTDSTKATKHRSRDGPNRVASLPVVELTSPTETPKKHTRAASFQPELLNGNAHVHPRLPDYDDFVARLTALRGNRGD
ncbi:hypothetical protein Pfo_012079 [Paulownia fortunei]|nr:hypothetical protein Pfo_012079 [Paulownia fortunei]